MSQEVLRPLGYSKSITVSLRSGGIPEEGLVPSVLEALPLIYAREMHRAGTERNMPPTIFGGRYDAKIEQRSRPESRPRSIDIARCVSIIGSAIKGGCSCVHLEAVLARFFLSRTRRSARRPRPPQERGTAGLSRYHGHKARPRLPNDPAFARSRSQPRPRKSQPLL